MVFVSSSSNAGIIFSRTYQLPLVTTVRTRALPGHVTYPVEHFLPMPMGEFPMRMDHLVTLGPDHFCLALQLCLSPLGLYGMLQNRYALGCALFASIGGLTYVAQ
jgi:hypothetical protein